MAVTSAAVSALLKPLADHGRNSFPLDNKHVYSMKAGQITPVKCFHYEPESYFDIQASDFSITFPMQTAPFLRGRKEFSFYSVYYNAIWSLYNQYQGTRQNPKTSAFGNAPRLVEPRISLFDMYYNVLYQFAYYLVYQHVTQAAVDAGDVFGLSVSSLSHPDLLRQYRLGFQNAEYVDHHIINYKFKVVSASGSSSVEVDFSHTFTYPFNSDGVFSFYDSSASVTHLNEEYFCDIVGHPRVYSWLRKLDMLGYGNYYPYFNSFERRIIDGISAINKDSITGTTSLDKVQAYITEVYKVIDAQLSLLGRFLASRLIVFSVSDSGIPNVSPSAEVSRKYCNLYPICAYNSVFYHFFRNSFYDNQYSSHDYSIDFVSVVTGDDNSLNLVYPTDFTLRFLDIEYHQWKKDVFTGVLPDTQFGAVSNVDVSLPADFLLRFRNSVAVPVGSSVNVGSDSVYSGSFVGVGSLARNLDMVGAGRNFSPSSFDVIALKRAEMLQQYRQTLMRAGNKTSDVFKALYGSSPSSEHEEDIVPRFLDTFGEDIFVDPVISQSNTGSENPNGQLGDIAARAKFSGQSGHIKFNSGGNFGCIICFAYVIPTAEYNSTMFDKHIFELTPEQHYIPQFGNYGLVPIYSDELNCFVDASQVSVLGYSAPYYHKKSEVDQVHGAFCSLPAYNALQLESSDGLFTYALPAFDWFGDFNNWVSPRSDMQFRNFTTIRDFYVNPSVLDNVFVRAAGADQSDDQFICNTYFDVKAVKGMSKSGLINFV